MDAGVISCMDVLHLCCANPSLLSTCAVSLPDALPLHPFVPAVCLQSSCLITV